MKDWKGREKKKEEESWNDREYSKLFVRFLPLNKREILKINW